MHESLGPLTNDTGTETKFSVHEKKIKNILENLNRAVDKVQKQINPILSIPHPSDYSRPQVNGNSEFEILINEMCHSVNEVIMKLENVCERSTV